MTASSLLLPQSHFAPFYSILGAVRKQLVAIIALRKYLPKTWKQLINQASAETQLQDK